LAASWAAGLLDLPDFGPTLRAGPADGALPATDDEATMTQVETHPPSAPEASEDDGSFGRVVALAAGLMAAVGASLFLPRQYADYVVLICLGVLATVGVLFLFAAAAGLLRVRRETAQRRAQAELQAAFFESLGEGALLTAPDGRAAAANPGYLKLYGADSERDLRSVERLFSENPDAAEAVYRLATAAEQGRRTTEEIRMPGGIGGQATGARWYRVRVNPIAGRPGYVGWLVSDITREREHQENIFQELQNAIDYLDHAPAGFFSLEPDGRLRYINATLAEWLGIDLAEFEPGSARIADFVTMESLSIVEAARPARAEAGAERLDVDLVRADGTRLPVRLLHRVPVAPDGTIGASRTLVLDTKGDAGAEAGRLAELRFSRFFNSAPMAIASVDRDGRLGIANARFVMLFGKGEATGRRLAEIVQPSDREALAAALDAALAGQHDVAAIDAALAAAPERSARFFLSPVSDSDGHDAAIVYALDTTEQRDLEAQFAQSQKMQAVGQLAGGIAHDFNNVLTAIIGFSDLLLTSHRPTDPSFQDIMNIKQNANRAAGLVRQLLAFSRRQTLRPRVLALGELLSDLSVLLDRLLGEKVKLTVGHGSELWPVKADLNQLEQVIVNLAVNARDAMPAGGELAIRTANVGEAESKEYRQPGFRPADYVLIEVADTGIGMPPEVLDKIFEPFFSTKDVGKGTGLGLSTVYGIVKQTGGFIFVDSEVGKGTTFRILLPRHMPQPSEEAAAKEQAGAKGPSDLTGNARILLVEDEESVRAFAARALAARGYQVYEAASGAEALEVLDRTGGAVDLVVSDVVMPGMDGPTLLTEIRKRRPDVKMIFISGYAEDAFARHLPDDESFQFLAKPFSLKELATAVKQTLAM
jgi:two-component system, cell cycle sensor histidine kinase and response regulator CckA